MNRLWNLLVAFWAVLVSYWLSIKGRIQTRKLVRQLRARTYPLAKGPGIYSPDPQLRDKVVVYGRSIEVGKFGRGPSGKVWFGWEAEVLEGTKDQAMDLLRARADKVEADERESFRVRTWGKGRGE
jgi:hypothetical protein